MSLIVNYLVKAALEKGFYSYILVSIKSSFKLFRADKIFNVIIEYIVSRCNQRY